jgi:hypothetical protein
MFKGFNNRQQNGFVNLNFAGDRSAYNQNGCTFWLRADFGTNTTTDNAAISSWSDITNSITYQQLTAGSQPKYNLSNVSYNNNPTIDFFDNARFLQNLGNIRLPYRTFVCVANYDTINTRNTIFGIDSNNGFFLGGTGAGVTGIGFTEIGALQSITTIENTSPHIVIYTDNLIIVDGVVRSTTAYTIDTAFTQISSSTTTQSLIGKVAELIGYDVPLTQDQALSLSNTINQKYAIY